MICENVIKIVRRIVQRVWKKEQIKEIIENVDNAYIGIYN